MSNGMSKARVIAGYVLHGLIGALLIFAGVGNAFRLVPAMVEGLTKAGLGDQATLIGAGALASGVLLLIPRTMSIGLLLTSAYFGGAICLHMSKGEPYVGAAVFLVMTWLGAFLRDGRTLGGLGGRRETAGRPATDS